MKTQTVKQKVKQRIMTERDFFHQTISSWEDKEDKPHTRVLICFD